MGWESMTVRTETKDRLDDAAQDTDESYSETIDRALDALEGDDE